MWRKQNIHNLWYHKISPTKIQNHFTIEYQARIKKNEIGAAGLLSRLENEL